MAESSGMRIMFHNIIYPLEDDSQLHGASLTFLTVLLLGNKSTKVNVRRSKKMESHVPNICSFDTDAATYKNYKTSNPHHGTITVKAYFHIKLK